MPKALYVPVFTGELGWEVINYVPHVNYICSQSEYDEVHVVVRDGRECLYPMGTHFYPVSLSTRNSMGNGGVSAPRNNIASQLVARGLQVDEIGIPKSGMRYIKTRKYLRYKANQNILSKWNIPENGVTMLVRGRKFGSHKNWASDNWIALCEYILSKSLVPIITGLQEQVTFQEPAGCLNLQGQTTLEDLLTIMQRSKFAVGQSTGPAHFASLAGVPHAIWGSRRIEERYTGSWNPHKTVVEYHVCGEQFKCSIESAIALVDRICNRLGT